jgi:hypothetical protein
MLILEGSQGCYGRTDGRNDGRKDGRTIALLYPSQLSWRGDNKETGNNIFLSDFTIMYEKQEMNK